MDKLFENLRQKELMIQDLLFLNQQLSSKIE
jgi:hypothetical protein